MSITLYCLETDGKGEESKFIERDGNHGNKTNIVICWLVG